VKPLFEKYELQARADRARAVMDELGHDALLVTGDFSAGMNYYYFSGHLPRDFQQNYSRPHVMVLPRDGEPFLYVYDVNAENARDAAWVGDVLAYAPPFDGGALARVLKERGLGSSRIGVELGTDQRLAMTHTAFAALAGSLPGAELVDAAPLVWRLRTIKSDAEVAYIREANRVNGEALQHAFGSIRSGDTELDVARKVGAAIVEAGSYRPPYAQVNILAESKSRALGSRARLLGPIGEYALGDGDLLFVDSGAVIGGYWGEFGRMAVVGEPSDAQRAHHDAIREIVRLSVEAHRPGAPFRALVEEMARAYRACGYGEEQFAGYLAAPFTPLSHGVGLAGSEPPFVRLDSDAVLEPGMVVTCEAYLTADGMTYASEEDVLVTADGTTLLSEPDTGLFVMGGS
jgi:Xaa-Pro dipeptidase